MELTLKQRISLWKAIPTKRIDETDKFIEELVNHIDILERRNDLLEYNIKALQSEIESFRSGGIE